MNARTAIPTAPPLSVWPLWTLRCVALAWAGFWTWFVLVDGAHDIAELGWKTLVPMAAILTGVNLPVVLAWRRPLAGAVALALAGVVALFVFRGASAQLLLAAPALALALGFGVLAWWQRGERRPR